MHNISCDIDDTGLAARLRPSDRCMRVNGTANIIPCPSVAGGAGREPSFKPTAERSQLISADEAAQKGALPSTGNLQPLLPLGHHKHMKSTSMLERHFQELKQRTHVVGIFPDPESRLRLVRSLAEEVHGNQLEATRYLNMEHLRERKKEALQALPPPTPSQ